MSKKNSHLLVNHISNLPDIYWILIGFLIPFFLFFIRVAFLKGTPMQFLSYVPANKEFIGGDLTNTLNIAKGFLENQQTPYIGNHAYAPFVNIFVAPLLVFNNYFAYKIVTILNMLCYFVMALIIPCILSKKIEPTPQLILIFITGLFSYGLQFELERGQFNLLALTLSFLAILIFHYRPKYSIVAYILFVSAVQIKVYPLIFILLFARDLNKWKENILRFMLLGVANFAALFILGYGVFLDFINAIISHMKYPPIMGVNHSIKSFVTIFSNHAANYGYRWLQEIGGFIELLLLLFVIGCVILVLIKSKNNHQKGLNKYLLLVCTLGALLIPSASHDYTLSYLAAPVAILFNDDFRCIRPNRLWPRILFNFLLVAFSTAYFSTIFSYAYKPQVFIIRNNFLPLFFMLVIITIIYFFYQPQNRN